MAQVGSAVQGTSAIRRRLTMLLAIVLIAAMVTLLAVAGVFASGTITGGDANLVPPPSVDLSSMLSYVH